MTGVRILTRTMVAAASAALLVSCGLFESAPNPPPTAVTLSITASPFLNPDLNRRPSPLVLRVYQLKETTAFNEADYFKLYEQDEATLGAAMLGKSEIVVAPGDITDLDLTVDAQTRFIGVLASFRDIDNAVFRAAIQIAPNATTDLGVDLQSNAVQLTGPPAPIIVDDNGESSNGGGGA